MCRAFSAARVSSVFQLLVCRGFPVVRVSSVFSCSERFQLLAQLVCRALPVNRMLGAFGFYLYVVHASCVFSCSYVDRAFSIAIFAFLMCQTFSVARVSSGFQLLVCRAFLVARVPCYSPVRRGSSGAFKGAFKGAFNLRCLEVLPLLILGYLVCLILPL